MELFQPLFLKNIQPYLATHLQFWSACQRDFFIGLVFEKGEIYFIRFLIDSPHQLLGELGQEQPPSCPPIFEQIYFFLLKVNLIPGKTEVLIFPKKDLTSTFIIHHVHKGPNKYSRNLNLISKLYSACSSTLYFQNQLWI